MLPHKKSLLPVCLLCFTLFNLASAKSIVEPTDKPVDLVIALDVSSSMSGLIESTKQRLWDIVNELGRAQPAPDLRIAIVTFGNPNYGEQSGYVRINQHFTRDLDSINETLFSFSTNGGDEYVARAIDTALNQLSWSTQSDALKIMFVAGNESAYQDPQIQVSSVAQSANSQGVVINTIYCGPAGDDIAAQWANVANATQGLFASINQDAAAVANVATPMDDELAQLNQELNKTYIAYGTRGEKAKQNQQDQDEATAELSAPAVASRTITKASSLYKTSWDLADALEAGTELESIKEEELPEQMRGMTDKQKSDYVNTKKQQRDSLKKRIQVLGELRRDFIAEQRQDDAENGLDQAMIQGLRKVAAEKGLQIQQ